MKNQYDQILKFWTVNRNKLDSIYYGRNGEYKTFGIRRTIDFLRIPVDGFGFRWSRDYLIPELYGFLHYPRPFAIWS